MLPKREGKTLIFFSFLSSNLTWKVGFLWQTATGWHEQHLKGMTSMSCFPPFVGPIHLRLMEPIPLSLSLFLSLSLSRARARTLSPRNCLSPLSNLVSINKSHGFEEGNRRHGFNQACNPPSLLPRAFSLYQLH